MVGAGKRSAPQSFCAETPAIQCPHLSLSACPALCSAVPALCLIAACFGFHLSHPSPLSSFTSHALLIPSPSLTSFISPSPHPQLSPIHPQTYHPFHPISLTSTHLPLLTLPSSSLSHRSLYLCLMQPQFSMAINSDFSGSPTLFYPNPQHHTFDYFSHNQSFQSPLSNWGLSNSTAPTRPKPTRPPFASNPSRKRSRDEFSSDDLPPPTPATAGGLETMEVIEEPIYGEGMVLLNPRTGASISASSQSGTWLEEKHEEERVAAEKAAQEAEEASRAQIMPDRPAKVGRLEQASVDLQPELSTSPASSIITPAATAAFIDPASALLGVGWKVVSRDDEDIQKAVRGWARYIEVHYPLGEVEILLKSEGQEAYLVRATRPQESWWLFKEDLSEGRLLSTTWEGAVAGLRSVPIAFEGEVSIVAQRTPSPPVEMPLAPPQLAAPVAVGMDLD